VKYMYIVMCAVFSCAAALMIIVVVSPAEGLGDSSVLLYLHVPLALCATVSFVLSGLNAFLYLRNQSDVRADASYAAARLGLIFTVLTTATGALWARLAWGSFWNNDPRETSIVFLLIVYTAYFALRSALGEKPGAKRISAVYLMFSAAIMPFFVFVVPRIYPSLHPDTIINGSRTIFLTGGMRVALAFSACAGLSLFMILYTFEKRLACLSHIRKDSI